MRYALHRTQRRRWQAWAANAAVCGLLLVLFPLSRALAADPTALLRAAFDNWRAKSSRTEITMTVHRPDWERTMTMTAWTRGDEEALVRFTAPAKDAGNATLKDGDDTWIYNPKLNQVIKLPASMLAQSWMGSDFSYNDLSKADDILTKYTHTLTGTEEADGHTVYTIEAVPYESAPVVWGKLVVTVRDDGVMLSETYLDQDLAPVRRMTTEKVAALGGRPYPVLMVMRPVGEPGKWTRIETTFAEFDIPLENFIFTLSNLQNPRE